MKPQGSGFQAQLLVNKKFEYLGTFDTREEAALAVARRKKAPSPKVLRKAKRRAEAAADPPKAARRAVRRARKLGLELRRSKRSKTGYFGVRLDKRTGRYRALPSVNGVVEYLRYYATREEAALRVAKRLKKVAA